MDEHLGFRNEASPPLSMLLRRYPYRLRTTTKLNWIIITLSTNSSVCFVLPRIDSGWAVRCLQTGQSRRGSVPLVDKKASICPSHAVTTSPNAGSQETAPGSDAAMLGRVWSSTEKSLTIYLILILLGFLSSVQQPVAKGYH